MRQNIKKNKILRNYPWVLLTLLLATAPLLVHSPYYAADRSARKNNITAEEVKAIRREMIDYDLYIRNIASHLVLNQSEELARDFGKLALFKNLESPAGGKEISSALQKLENTATGEILGQYQAIAADTETYITNELKEKRSPNLNLIAGNYIKIIAACRACHEKYNEEFTVK